MKLTKGDPSKKLIVFDLDGTLAPSKSTMDSEMASLVKNLLENKKVAVIGGGKFDLFDHQLLSNLKVPDSLLKNLFLFPVTATTFYKYEGGWKKQYAHDLTKEEIKQIMEAFKIVYKKLGYKDPPKTYGNVIENRGSQVTWSALGQDIVAQIGQKGIEAKDKWKEENTHLKLKIAKELSKLLPNLEVHAAGFTSIDITKKGIDKSYGLREIEKYLKIKIKDMLFVGDAIFPGGNDYAITKTSVDYVAIKDPQETKKVIRQVLASD